MECDAQGCHSAAAVVVELPVPEAALPPGCVVDGPLRFPVHCCTSHAGLFRLMAALLGAEPESRDAGTGDGDTRVAGSPRRTPEESRTRVPGQAEPPS
jgi:hypothetical protein